MKRLSRRSNRPQYKYKPYARPAYRRVEIPDEPKIPDSELKNEIRVIIQPGNRMMRAKTAATPQELKTIWDEFKIQSGSTIKNVRCKKTTYNSRTLLCDLRSRDSINRYSHHVNIPHRSKKYQYTYDSLPTVSEISQDSKKKHFLKLF